MRALMARARGAEGGLLGSRWKSQLLVLLVLLIGSSVESSASDNSSAKSETGLMVVTHTSGETRQKRAGEDGGAYGGDIGGDCGGGGG